MNLLRSLRGFSAVVGAAVLSGCYSYVPVEHPSPGSTVRIQVPLRSAVSRPNQPDEIVSLEGVVVTAADSIVLEVQNRREFGAFREIRTVDTLRVAQADLTAIDTRIFSRGKTLGLTAAIVGVTGILAATAFGLGGGSGGDDGPGNGNGTTTGSLVVNPIFSALLRAVGR